MATDIRIIHAHDFVKATPEGKFDFERSKILLTEIALAASPLGDCQIILDTRKAQVEMSVTQLWYLAVELSNLRKDFSGRTAVLCPLDRFDDAEFFALCVVKSVKWTKNGRPSRKVLTQVAEFNRHELLATAVST